MTERTSARSEPGTLREYETVLILRPDLMDDMVASVNDKITGILDKHAGKLLRVEAWGRRRLAYRIAKQPKGLYYYWRYLANNAILDDMDHYFRMSENVLRQLTIVVDENVHPDARPADVEPEALDPRLRADRLEAEKAAREAKEAEEQGDVSDEQATAQPVADSEAAAPDAGDEVESSDKVEAVDEAEKTDEEPEA